MEIPPILRSLGRILQTAIVAIAVFAAVVYTMEYHYGGNNMSWSETFTGPAGSPPNAMNWTAVQGSGVAPAGGGNNELETYTPEAAELDGKNDLVITGNLVNGQYTSAKIWTIGLVNFKYGHIAIRAALPDAGKSGYWPAIWMLGADYPSVGWPSCGEIDIMEAFGVNGLKNQISSSLHTTTDSTTQAFTFPAGQDATGFHVYSLDWRPTSMTFSVDGNAFYTVYKSQLGTWPFDKPFFLILNVALGGTMGGNIPAGALPYTMVVNYVNVNGSVMS